MASTQNEVFIQNQAGTQIIHGDLIFRNDDEHFNKRLQYGFSVRELGDELSENILAKLSFPEMLDRRSNVEIAHQQTCQWILKLEEYRQWRRRSNRRGLLWIKGKPGSGKSTLMSYLCSRLSHERRGSDLYIEFFYSARGTVLQRTPLGMFRSFLNQLYCHDKAVRDILQSSYEDKSARFGNARSDWEWQLSELKNLFTKAVTASASIPQRQFIVLVDALDEAGPTVAQDAAYFFHEIYESIVKLNGNIKICISCRHYPIISHVKATEVHVDQHNHSDIESYIRDRIEIDETASNFSQWSALKQDLGEAAHGIFQWVHLIVPMVNRLFMDGYSPSHVSRMLEKTPQALEDVYRHIIETVIDRNSASQSLRLFQWVCLAVRPLTVTEIRYAIASCDIVGETASAKCHESVDFINSDESMQNLIRSWSRGLIETTRSGKLQITHQTVKEFMTTRGLSILTSICEHIQEASLSQVQKLQVQQQPEDSHRRLYMSCLKYLATETVSGEDLSFNEREALRTNSPFILYAVDNALEHARLAQGCVRKSVEEECRLLDRSILTWQSVSRHETPIWPESRRLHDERLIRKGSTILHLAVIAQLEYLMQYRVDAGDNVGIPDEAGWTAFHVAAFKGQLSSLQQLVTLSSAQHLWTKTLRSETLLWLAVTRGHMEIFFWLVEQDIDLLNLNEDVESLLYLSAANNNITVCKACIDAGPDLDAAKHRFGTALQTAVIENHEDIVRLLLAAGADPEARGAKTRYAFQQPDRGRYPSIAELMAEASLDGNPKDQKATSPLCSALILGHLGIVHLLLEAGADANFQGNLGYPLQIAVLNGQRKMVQVLLAHGARVSAQGGYYGSAIQAAACNGFNKIARSLIKAGADVNTRGGYYGTALQAAAYYGYLPMCRRLLQAGADPNVQGGRYGNALQAAAVEGHEEIVYALLQQGADVNLQGGQYGNALQAAALHGHEWIVHLLLEAGADVNAEGGEFKDALQAAAAAIVLHNASDAIMELLLDAGARVITERRPRDYLRCALPYCSPKTAAILRAGGVVSIQERFKSVLERTDAMQIDDVEPYKA